MSAFRSRATLLVAASSAVATTLASCGYSATVAPAAPPSPKAATAAADPRTGVAYPFELYTHCGISTAGFGGRDWQAIMPRPQPALVLLSAPDGTVIHTDHTVGTMTLMSPDLLRFSYKGGSVDFTPFPAGPHPACA